VLDSYHKHRNAHYCVSITASCEASSDVGMHIHSRRLISKVKSPSHSHSFMIHVLMVLFQTRSSQKTPEKPEIT